jgi:signal peptidase I
MDEGKEITILFLIKHKVYHEQSDTLFSLQQKTSLRQAFFSPIMHYMEKNKDTSSRSQWIQTVREIIQIVIVAIVLVVPIRFFIAQPFIVSGASMFPTFENKDYLIIDELSYRIREPRRGEVIVFKYPEQPKQFFIKRIIGLPGETVTIENNTVTITNTENPEGFILDQSFLDDTVLTTKQGNPSVTLDEGHYFVMGDNRARSSDSRIWGSLDQDLIIGRAWLRLWPLQNINFLPGDANLENKTIPHSIINEVE